eukprot:scaffold42261_cov20-Cyclotella_meneghiniana.AAC.1
MAVGCRAGERLSLSDGRPAVAMIEGSRLLVQRWCCHGWWFTSWWRYYYCCNKLRPGRYTEL